MLRYDEQMEMAIQLARSGNREPASVLFRQIVEQSPASTDAWLWLSELTDDLTEQVTALENAIKYSPQVSSKPLSLQERINAIRGTSALPPPAASPALKPQKSANHAKEEMFRQAERLIILGKTDEAVALLTDLIDQEPVSESALLLLSELRPDPAEKVRLLEQVLVCNPRNTHAAHTLQALRPLQRQPLQAGEYLEANGELDQAVAVYRMAAAKTQSEVERMEANRRIRRIEQRQGGEDSHVSLKRTGLLQETARRIQGLTRGTSL